VEILVDDEIYQSATAAEQTVRELTNELREIAGANRLVVALRCNGKPVSDDELDEVLAAPATRYERIEIQTQPLQALVRATLTQAIELLDDSPTLCERIADLLDEGNQEAAMGEFRRFLELWKQVQQTLVISAEALDTDLDAFEVDGHHLTDVLEQIKTRLAELKDAMEQGDLVLVGDILRYEFDEPFANWTTLLNHLRDQVPEAENS
jgi:hypothetical protein